MIEVVDLNVGVIKNLSFKTNSKIFVIFGKNGSGKTTLAESIMGFRKYKGNILLNGQSIDKLNITERAKLGISIMPQILPKYNMSVREYLSITTDEIEEKLETLGIQHLINSKIKDLSGGERKKVEFISIMYGPFQTVILDEPDSGVDMYSIPIMYEIMKKSEKEILLITHREEMLRNSNGIVLENGKLIYSGELNGFLSNK